MQRNQKVKEERRDLVQNERAKLKKSTKQRLKKKKQLKLALLALEFILAFKSFPGYKSKLQVRSLLPEVFRQLVLALAAALLQLVVRLAA